MMNRSGLRRRRLTTAVTVLALGPALALATVTTASAVSTPTFVVTTTADGADASINGICATATGECTLRAALAESNVATGHATITFNIPGPAPHVFTPASKLPSMWNPAGTTIDGYTNPDATPNTSTGASNAVITIELVGKGPGTFDGLFIASGANVVRGLAIRNFWRQIYLSSGKAVGNSIIGNYICTNAAGTWGSPVADPKSNGILLTGGAADNLIGAPGPANRNVVSGCGSRAITLSFTPTSRNKIQNNIVGLNPAGTNRLPNYSIGIDVNYTASNIIGGDNPGEGNVISGNGGSGVEVSHGSNTRYNLVAGNFIGTDLSGTAAPSWAGNLQWGIRFEGAKFCGDPTRPNPDGCTIATVAEGLPHHNTARNNVIVNNGRGGMLIDKGQHDDVISGNWIGVLPDGTAAANRLYGISFERGAYNNVVAAGNTIAYNPVGVVINSNGFYPPGPAQPTYGMTITKTSFFSNVGPGIDLVETTQTQPDGTNYVQGGILPPVLKGLSKAVSATTCPSCRVEVYVADSAAGREGKTYVASATANTSGVVTVSLPSVAAGTFVTATATDQKKNSSEFSATVAVLS